MTSTIDAATHARFVEERITKTSMITHKGSEYDQCTFISQAAINDQLRYMWMNEDALSKIDVSLDSGQTLTAECNAPEIKLAVGAQSQMVTFYVNFKSGAWGGYRIEIVNKKPVIVTEPDIDVSGWKLAFNVNLAFDQLDRKNVPQSVKDKLLNFNDYSIWQLLVDFTTADITNYVGSESVLKIPDGKRGTWDALMVQYLGNLKGGATQALYYLPKRTSGTGLPVAPTLVPTSLNFMTLPFLPGSANLSATEKGKYGMLVYLQMTDNHSAPMDLLMDTANWVVPPLNNTSERYDGTVALSKTAFLKGWLLPKLAHFNQVSAWWVDEAWWKATDPAGTGIGKNYYNLYGHMGLTDAEVAKITGGVAWVEQKREAGAKAHTFKWSFPSKIDDDHGLWRVYEDALTENELTIPDGLGEDGKCTITVKGKCRVTNYVHLDGMGDWGKAYGTVTNTWSGKLVIDGTQDGKLIITGDKITPTITHDTDNSWLYPSIVNNLNTQMEKLMGFSRLQSVATDMGNFFSSGAWQFIFAGSRDFYIDRACFNTEGDFLCELKYKSQ